MMACLRSSVASMIAAPKRALNRCTSSLSRGTGFGGASFGGAAGFGVAGAPAAAAGAAGFGGAAAPAGAEGTAGFAAGGVGSPGAAAAGAGFSAGGVAGFGVSAGFAGSADAAGGGAAAGSLDFGGVPPPPAPLGGGVVASLFVGSSAICFLESSFRIQASSATRRASVSPVSIPARKSRAQTPPIPVPKPCGVHSQSSAPFRNSQTYPTIKMPRNTSIVNSPYVPREL